MDRGNVEPLHKYCNDFYSCYFGGGRAWGVDRVFTKNGEIWKRKQYMIR